MDLAPPLLPESETEALAAQHLGRLLFVFGRLELNLGLALACTRPAADYALEAARVGKLSFDVQLLEFEHQALLRHAGDLAALARWEKWFSGAHALRKLRSDFAHGRWGFLNVQQQIVHATALPDAPQQDEVRYTLDEFAAQVAAAEDLAEEFCLLDDLYPVDRVDTPAAAAAAAVATATA